MCVLGVYNLEIVGLRYVDLRYMGLRFAIVKGEVKGIWPFTSFPCYFHDFSDEGKIEKIKT